VRIVSELFEQAAEQTCPWSAAIMRPQYAPQRFTTEPCAASFIRDQQSPPANTVPATLEDSPADRSGADDDDTAIVAAMRTDAGCICICRDCRMAERVILRLRRSQRGRFTGACERQTGGYSRQIRGGQTGLMKAKVRSLVHGRKTVFQSKPDVGRAGETLAEDRARRPAEPRAAVGSTAINPKKEQLRSQIRPFRKVMVLNARERFGIDRVILNGRT
jgi:hypothetical protein